MKRKKRKPGATVRAIARERLGTPRPSHAIKDKRHAEKHKKDPLQETEE